MTILIKSGNIIDGAGRPKFRADLLIKDDKIAAIGIFPNKTADLTIDALGLNVVPGFIDVNTDSDHYLTLFTNPLQEDFLLQGVTTIIGGQCGSSLAPLFYGSLKSIRTWTTGEKINIDWNTINEFKGTLRKLGLGVNFGTLIGHSTIRRDLAGDDIRDLTDSEISVFQHTIESALKEGALGLSTGLSYIHSRFVSYSEIKKLLKPVIRRGGVYATHLRDEKKDLIKSVKETAFVAEEIGIPTIISHFRPIAGFEEQFREALSIIENNLHKQNVFFDINPFGMSIMPIYTFLPPWTQQESLEKMLEYITDKNHRLGILKELSLIENNLENLVIGEAENHPSLAGKTLGEFSESRGLDLAEGLLMLMEITNLRAQLFYNNINSDLLPELLFHPQALIASNSASLGSQAALKPERSTGTFKKFLKLAAEKNLPMEETIRKITSVPAKIFKIKKRGVLSEGNFADLALLKENEAVHVIINGKLSVQEGKITNQKNGIPL